MKNTKRNDNWKNLKNKRSRTPSTAIYENQIKLLSVDEWLTMEVIPR